MKKYFEDKQVQLAAAEKSIRRTSSLLKLISDESLFRNMHKAAYFEEYERAIAYRDELLRRGKLLTAQ